METNEGVISAEEVEEAAAAIIGKLDSIGDMKFGYSEFLAICADEDEQEDNYLGFYRIDRKAGVFTQDVPDDIRRCLTSTEASILSEHPLKDLNEPILSFPFTAAQLKAFMQWSANRGVEIPVGAEALDEAIAQNRQEEAQASTLRQRERATPKDAEIKPDSLYLQAHEDEVGPMPEAAPAAEQPSQRCAPRNDEEAKLENPQMAGLKRENDRKNIAKKRAKVIAEEHWKADTEKKIRIGEMADLVYKKLIDEGFLPQLPENIETLKNWIRPVAPEYACKGGRPQKTP